MQATEEPAGELEVGERPDWADRYEGMSRRSITIVDVAVTDNALGREVIVLLAHHTQRESEQYQKHTLYQSGLDWETYGDGSPQVVEQVVRTFNDERPDLEAYRSGE